MTQEELIERAFEENGVPYQWAYCFNEQCPRHDDCAAYLSSKFLKESPDYGNAIYPNACRDGACRHFKRARVVRTAWGFSHLFDNVKKKDAERLKTRLMNYFGNRSYYYRYKRGDYHLSPAQQEWISNLFKRYGYDEVNFQYYKNEIDFCRE